MKVRRNKPQKYQQTLLPLLILTITVTVVGADWPQWRGPNRDGVWRETGIGQSFETEQLPVRWRVKISSGYNSPVVANGRVYVMDYVTTPQSAERVHCFDALTGKAIWSYAYKCEYRNVSYPAGPRAAITVSENQAYSLGTMGHLYCFDARTGKVVWQRDLNQEYAIRMPTWGIAAAPLVIDALVIVQIGGREDACVVAFDKLTGQEKWRALDDGASYSAPIVIQQAGKKVFVVWTGERVVGLEPQTGKIYWEHPFKQLRGVHNIATPVWSGDFLFLSSFFDGSLLLKLNRQRLAVERVWRRFGSSERQTESLHCCISTPILKDNYIYGVDSYGELRCLELLTGERVWENREVVPIARWANVHLVQQDSLTWLFNEKGELIIGQLSPAGFREISRALLIRATNQQHPRGVCWAHPAFANKSVYARNDEELICVELGR